MRLRHRVLLLLGALLAGALGAYAVFATGLLTEAAAQGTLEAADAGVGLLWLGAGAVAALAIGLGGVASRLWLVAPLESLAREAGAHAGAKGEEEIAVLRDALSSLRQAAQRAEVARTGQLDAIQALLDRADDRLASTDRLAMTGQLALGAAHELGSPLAIAVACVDSLRATLPGGADYVDQIDEALGRVDAILRELNDFGLQEGNARAVGAEARCRPADVIAATLTLARLHKKCRRVTLTPPASPAPQGFAAIAPRHLEQVLLNLLINAADATENQGQVAVGLSRDDPGEGGRWLVTVDDDGPGVAEDQRDQIFAPFFTTKPPGVGSGLGLPVSRRLLRAAGGDLEVTTSPLGGARFVVRVPAE